MAVLDQSQYSGGDFLNDIESSITPGRSRRSVAYIVPAGLFGLPRVITDTGIAISQYKWSWFRRPRRLIDMVRFDEASRGLLGSLKFLFRPRKS